MASENLEINRKLKPAPLSFLSPRKVFESKSGPCDTAGENDRNSMVEWRYASILFTLSAVAGGFATIAADTVRNAFREGVDDPGTNAGFGTMVLSQTETNLFTGGSLNDAKEGMFVGRSFGVIAERPFAFDGATRSKDVNQFWEPYSVELLRLLAENIYLTIANKDESVNRFLGTLPMWPSPSSMTGDGLATVATPWGPANMIPFNDDYRFYDNNRGNNTQIIATVPNLLRIASDPANPIPTGFSQEFKLIVYGGPVSELAACAVDRGGMTGEKLRMYKEFRADGLSGPEAIAAVKELSGNK